MFVYKPRVSSIGDRNSSLNIKYSNKRNRCRKKQNPSCVHPLHHQMLTRDDTQTLFTRDDRRVLLRRTPVCGIWFNGAASRGRCVGMFEGTARGCWLLLTVWGGTCEIRPGGLPALEEELACCSFLYKGVFRVGAEAPPDGRLGTLPSTIGVLPD